MTTLSNSLTNEGQHPATALWMSIDGIEEANLQRLFFLKCINLQKIFLFQTDLPRSGPNIQRLFHSDLALDVPLIWNALNLAFSTKYNKILTIKKASLSISASNVPTFGNCRQTLHSCGPSEKNCKQCGDLRHIFFIVFKDCFTST